MRLLGSALLAALAAAAVLATVAAAAAPRASGSFHLAGGAVGCHWEQFGGSVPTASIRCERYGDHASFSLSRSGALTRVKPYGGWVRPGRKSIANGWGKTFSRDLSCQVVLHAGSPGIFCTATSGATQNYFWVGVGFAQTRG